MTVMKEKGRPLQVANPLYAPGVGDAVRFTKD